MENGTFLAESYADEAGEAARLSPRTWELAWRHAGSGTSGKL